MNNRITIKDIAAEVGVSAITVSKALNGKNQVSEKTRARIIETARRMDYRPNLNAKSLVRKEIHIACVYPKEPFEFYSYVKDGVNMAEKELLDSKCRVSYYEYSSLDSVGEVRDCLMQIEKEKVDGILLTSNHNYREYVDVLRRITESDCAVLYNTIFGEFIEGVIGGIGLNAYMAGQIAADFHNIGKTMLPEGKTWKTVIFVGNKNVSTHHDCIEGYRSRAKLHGIELLETYETNEDRNIAYYLTGKVLQNFPDLNGIYVSSYNALGVCEWLKEHNAQNRVLTIGHDLYPALNTMIESGCLKATLFQNQYEYGRKGMHLLFEYLVGLRRKEECRVFQTPQIVLPGMLSAFPRYGIREP